MTLKDWKEKKAALYIRRSQGERGSTKGQLQRVKKIVQGLEKEGKIAKFNYGIQGRSIDKKYRGTKFDGKSDIWNEGDGKSAFGRIEEREVLVELLSELNKGTYDVVIMETLDRLTRDPIEIGSAGVVDLYRRKGKSFQSLTNDEMAFEPDNPTGEMIAIALLGFTTLSKKAEIMKAKEALTGDTGESALDRGFVRGNTPEYLGRDTKSAGVSYRKLWNLFEAAGEQIDKETGKGKGIPNGTTELARLMGKVDWSAQRQTHIPNTKWIRQWYARMNAWNDLGVLEDWLKSYEAINQYISNVGPKHKHNYKNDAGIKRILTAVRGFMAYPAGLNPKGTMEFVVFPKPHKVGLAEIASVDNPTSLAKFKVIRKPLGSKKLTDVQRQK
jgi:DNA invertase Pin-like site-specific DNA recombinase